MSGAGSEMEAMRDLASVLWKRFFQDRVREELNHEVNAFRAEVVSNNGDGTLTVMRPFETNPQTFRVTAPASYVRAGDQVLILGIGEKRKALSNAFVFCMADLGAFAYESTALAAFPKDTASGNPANFPDGADMVPVIGLRAAFRGEQSGSGTPSVDNLRPILGNTGLDIYRSGADTSVYDTVSVSWESKAGTVYGGTLDVTAGVLTADRVLATLTDEMSWSTYSPSGTQRGFLLSAADAGITDALAGVSSVTAPYIQCSLLPVGTTTWAHGYCGMQNKNIWFGFQSADFNGVNAFESYLEQHPIQMVLPITTPVTYQLGHTPVLTLPGENNIWIDDGTVEVTYRADPTLYIQKKLGA